VAETDLSAGTAREPGQVFAGPDSGTPLLIATGEGFLAPLELQLPGKKMVPVAEFSRGYRQIIGTVLGV
jgi:methionyl-tRNA formyltransferase